MSTSRGARSLMHAVSGAESETVYRLPRQQPADLYLFSKGAQIRKERRQ